MTGEEKDAVRNLIREEFIDLHRLVQAEQENVAMQASSETLSQAEARMEKMILIHQKACPGVDIARKVDKLVWSLVAFNMIVIISIIIYSGAK